MFIVSNFNEISHLNITPSAVLPLTLVTDWRKTLEYLSFHLNLSSFRFTVNFSSINRCILHVSFLKFWQAMFMNEQVDLLTMSSMISFSAAQNKMNVNGTAVVKRPVGETSGNC